MRYEIKRTNGSTERLIATVSPTGKQSKKAMGENVVDFSFTLPKYIDFKLMDFVLVYGERYQLNVLPSVKKVAKNSFEYNMQLEAVFYDLAKVQLQFLNTKNQLLEPSFTLMGNAGTIVGLIVENANRHSPGWSVGTVDDTGYKNFTFNAENCLQGLNRLAQDFETEFWIENKTIHLQKREQSSGMSFGYGQGKGLYSILRGNNKNINIVTRLYVRGSAQNLPAGYRNASGSLLLPGGKTYFEDPAKIALYGLIEASQVFDVKPEREGVVSGVVSGSGNWKFFTDSTIDFDLNTVKLEGPSKVRFNTGQLAGNSFEITAYNHQTKQVTIKKNEEEKAIEMPSDFLRPAIGDKYVLIDIAMPESYVSAAENRLNQVALAYYEKNSDPTLNFAYNIDCDPIWFKQVGAKVVLGNTVMITDTDMGINGEIRIAAYKRDLQSTYKYEFEVTDSIGANEIIRQYAQQQRTLQLIESSGLLDINQIRKNIFLNRLSEQDGYLMLSGTKIKAGVADYTPESGHSLKADYAKDSDQWDGRHFDDFISQPVRKTDAVTFLSVVADTVNSKGYVSGFTGTGYKINPDGSAEFDNLTVRKELNVNVLNVREITGGGGSIAITNVAKIKTVTENADYWSCQINTDDGTIAVQFRVNDMVRCQVWDGKRLKYYTARVRAVSAGIFDLDKAGKTGGGIPAAGDSVFQFGNTTDTSRQGLIYLTNSDTGAPYIDVLDGINSDSLAGKTKVRLGKLSGISDADLGELDGYGLYADRAFIKGKIVVTGGNAATNQSVADKIAAIQVGGENTYKQNQPMDAYSKGVIHRPHGTARNGFLLIGSSANDAIIRMGSVITGNGWWTISFLCATNAPYERYFRMDICDNPSKTFTAPMANVDNPKDDKGFARIVFSVNVQNWTSALYHFIDFEGLSYDNYIFRDVKVEKGNLATAWSLNTGEKDIINKNEAFARSYAGGEMMFKDPEFAEGFNGLSVYNNLSNGTVALGRGHKANFGGALPNSSGYYVEVKTSGAATPGAGGVCWAFQARALGVYVTRIIARMINPGDTINFASNSTGAGSSNVWVGSNVGTGDWQEFLHINYCGTGDLSSTGFFYLGTSSSTNIVWYIASATTYDMTNSKDPSKYTDQKTSLALQQAKDWSDQNTISKINISQALVLNSASQDAQAKANAAKDAADLLAKQLVDSMSFGGVNLMKNTANFTNTAYWGGASVMGGFTDSSACLHSYDISTGEVFYLEPVRIKKGTVYTWSGWIYSVGWSGVIGDTAPFHFWVGTNPDTHDWGYTVLSANQTVAHNEWRFCQVTFKTSGINDSGLLYMRPYIYGSGVIHEAYWTRVKLEESSKPTTWSPSPEDVQTAISNADTKAVLAQQANTALTGRLKTMAYRDIDTASKEGVTVIDRGSVVTFSVNAAYIKGNVVNADYINTFELNASKITTGTLSAARIDVDNLYVKNLRTATIGVKRVEINGYENNIRLYNSSNNVIIEIDDDSAIESPVGATPVYGPGIAVGISKDHIDGYSSLSRKQIFTTGSVSAQNIAGSQMGVLSPSGLFTTGKVEFWGDIRMTAPTGASFTGKTFTQNIGGGFAMRFIRGIYVDTIQL